MMKLFISMIFQELKLNVLNLMERLIKEDPKAMDVIWNKLEYNKYYLGKNDEFIRFIRRNWITKYKTR